MDFENLFELFLVEGVDVDVGHAGLEIFTVLVEQGEFFEIFPGEFLGLFVQDIVQHFEEVPERALFLDREIG